jgi:hypothetical protein
MPPELSGYALPSCGRTARDINGQLLSSLEANLYYIGTIIFDITVELSHFKGNVTSKNGGPQAAARVGHFEPGCRQ